ncbi:MAG: hypothetical protein IPF66_22780 [Holophagales bacterium]|nr:hypothetical protein [Holophagales bacterium]
MLPFAPIAIVGRSCILPGALDPSALWELVAAGRDLVGPAPEGRWGLEKDEVLCLPGATAPDASWSDRGGYVSGFEKVWDPSGFGVGETELEGLDPLCHWVLHTAREALRDSGDARAGSGHGVLPVPGRGREPSSATSASPRRGWPPSPAASGPATVAAPGMPPSTRGTVS